MQKRILIESTFSAPARRGRAESSPRARQHRDAYHGRASAQDQLRAAGRGVRADAPHPAAARPCREAAAVRRARLAPHDLDPAAERARGAARARQAVRRRRPLSEAVLADVVQPPPQPRWLADLLGEVPVAAARNADPRAADPAARGARCWCWRRRRCSWLVGARHRGRPASRVSRDAAHPSASSPRRRSSRTARRLRKSSRRRRRARTSASRRSTETFRPTVGATDSAEGVRFKTAVTEMYAVDVAARAAGVRAAEAGARSLPRRRPGIVTDAASRRTACRGSCSTASCCPSASCPTFDAVQFDEIMNYPRFDLPMYKPLVDLNSEYFLPNLNRIRAQQHHAARDQPEIHRGLHGGPQPRDGARAAVARIPDRPARQLLPPVLGRERLSARGRRGSRDADRAAQGHSGNPHLDAAASSSATTTTAR